MLYQAAVEREPLDRVLHALADPSRRSIVERLSRAPASVSELAEPLPMSLPAVVQHLKVLEEDLVRRAVVISAGPLTGRPIVPRDAAQAPAHSP